jgi:hypothetical protein
MDDQPIRRLSRRRFLTAAGLTAGSVAGLVACGPSGARSASIGNGFADAVVQAFKTHELVALGAADSLQEHYDALNLLLTDPRPRRHQRDRRRAGQPAIPDHDRPFHRRPSRR